LLAELRLSRDRAQERVDYLGPVTDQDALLALGHDWDRSSIEDHRRCIRATAVSAVVHRAEPGRRGADRIDIRWHDHGFDYRKVPMPPTDLE
jgi:hypothetical protein